MMTKQLEEKHALFDSVQDMLSLESMSELLGRQVVHITEHPIHHHDGNSGSQMSYVETNAGRYFLKRVSVNADYVMTITNDVACRSVRLWHYGLLDQLLPRIDHGIIACAYDGDGWAMLSKDLTSVVFTDDRPFSLEAITIFLDAMAYMHATFWNDHRLYKPELGLSDLTGYIRIFLQGNAQKYAAQMASPVAEWICDGWEMLPDFLAPDLYAQLYELHNNPQPLIDTVGAYPHTLLHNDFHPENLAYRDNGIPVLLDWQLATYSLMTIDLACFMVTAETWVTHDHDRGFQYYRERLETYLDAQFDDAEWNMMLDLGRCVHALRSLPIQVSLATKAPTAEMRKHRYAVVKQQEKYLIPIINRLSSSLF